MIDLHTHTNASDGTYSPERLVAAAAEARLEALAITDHDTFAGYERAIPFAAERRLDLVCGIELSTKYRGKSVHLLGYFLNGGASQEFRAWILRLQASRHLRNRELVENLRAKGCPITMEEVFEKGGTLPGRPHFAALLVEKGCVATIQQAFDEYLDESASCYAPREEPSFEEGVERVTAGGGTPSLPHPGRVSRDRAALEEALRDMRGMGLKGIEAYHSDHSSADACYYESLARAFDLVVTGGSDFHGEMKPKVALGSGINGNVNVPRRVLDELRQSAAVRPS